MEYLRQTAPYGSNPLGIQNCMYRFTYLWLKNGDNFWFFLTTVAESNIYGYRFFGGRWNFYSVALSEIVSFHCSPPTPTPY
ncbi:transporter [Bacillus sp. AFS002410]|uniref:transporter n=1 Tax=Bacillus sp. AFS002410 TaxID=2033481 RepID=UPI000BF10401|nr:transporter [Bacillus sp. AFS002410]PEJ56102.1 transporter [Bacillus sp. AFS002410]